MLARGMCVALGTDSRASVPDLDPWEEMAALADLHPGLDPSEVVRAATWAGARALGLADRWGTIEPGKTARLACVRPDDPARRPLESLCARPRDVERLDERAP
jgi:cytosine/adenosine deaminase-related metal-dependent hydrolase